MSMIRALPSGRSAMVAAKADFATRFHYWTGRSGRRYVHTIFPYDACPSFPGAPYLAVRRSCGGERVIMAGGRVSQLPGTALDRRTADQLLKAGVDEIHIHLLAGCDEERGEVMRDLSATVAGCEETV